MARSFGGKYSPGNDRQTLPDRPVVNPVGARANLLFLPPALLVFTSLGAGPVVLVTALAGAGLMTLAAWLLRGGLRAETAYAARNVARRPAIPRKILAALLTGAGVALAATTGDSDTLGSVLYGVAAMVLHVAAFGIDPLRDKLPAGVDSFQQDRVARVVDEAETHLATMTAQIARLNDRPLQIRVAGFQDTARRMIRTVEEDPRDLTAARKYLGVYLLGARDATSKFVDLTLRRPDPDARRHYLALMDDLDQNFAARTDNLLRDDRSDMDIEIKVLRDRLAREGIRET